MSFGLFWEAFSFLSMGCILSAFELSRAAGKPAHAASQAATVVHELAETYGKSCGHLVHRQPRNLLHPHRLIEPGFRDDLLHVENQHDSL